MSRKYLTLVENDFELDVEYIYAKTSFLVRLTMNFSVSDILLWDRLWVYCIRFTSEFLIDCRSWWRLPSISWWHEPPCSTHNISLTTTLSVSCPSCDVFWSHSEFFLIFCIKITSPASNSIEWMTDQSKPRRISSDRPRDRAHGSSKFFSRSDSAFGPI